RHCDAMTQSRRMLQPAPNQIECMDWRCLRPLAQVVCAPRRPLMNACRLGHAWEISLHCPHGSLEGNLFEVSETFEVAESPVDFLVSQSLYALSSKFFNVEGGHD